MAYLKKSPWLIHFDGSSCNGCDIEVLACLTPLYDVERFGIINTGNPKHADVLLITGSVNEQNRRVIQNLYHQMPDPKIVVALGICACSGGIFNECYNVQGGVDKVIPVDVFVPGCAARPESIIDGVVEALKVLDAKDRNRRSVIKQVRDLVITQAEPSDAEEILALQKICYRSEAEIYNDFSLPALTQTIDDIRNDFKSNTFFKAVCDGKIIGAVRGNLKGGTCYIKRLITHPTFQNYGIGTKLMNEIETSFKDANRYEIFTGHKSKRNIYFYEMRDYKIFKKEPFTPLVEWVYMEKTSKGSIHYT